MSANAFRFIIYVVPIVNLSAAALLVRLPSSLLLKTIIYSALLASLLGSSVAAYISSLNYPGGFALDSFNRLAQPGQSVHIDSFNAGTGISLFWEKEELVYSKDETLVDFGGFDYLLREWGKLQDFSDTEWQAVATIEGFERVRIKRVGVVVDGARGVLTGDKSLSSALPFEIKMTPKSVLLKNTSR